MNKILSNKMLIFLAFIEGAALMVCEIAAVKIIEPHFGNSLYVWAAVLAMTLSGLAIGYFFGGRLTQRMAPMKILFLAYFVAGILVIVMPLLGRLLMFGLIDFDVVLASLMSTLFFLLPPMALFGMIGPALIQLSVKDASDAGRVSGLVYAFSTLGGVINVLLAAIVLMPNFGVATTCYIFGILLIIAGISLAVQQKIGKVAICLFALIFTIASQHKINGSAYNKQKIYESTKMFGNVPMHSLKVLHESSGIFGKIQVVDINMKLSQTQMGKVRGLMVNNTWQTLNNALNGISMLDYVAAMSGIVEGYPELNSVLHIGLGGGHVSKIFKNLGKKVTAIEIDKEVHKVAKKYFELPKDVKVVIDDGRHFLNKNKEQFDIIVLNAFNSSIPPWQLFTKESFKLCYDQTSDNGIFIIEIGGSPQSDDDILLSSVCKTVEAAGWKINIIKTKKSSDTDYICLGYKDKAPNLSKFTYRIGDYSVNMADMLVDRKLVANVDQVILNDDLPILTKWASQRSNSSAE